MGRRMTLTPQVEQRFLDAIRAGAYLETAARFAGVSPTTVHEWIARGKGTHQRRATKQLREFAEKVEQARAQPEMQALTTLMVAIRGGDTQSARWYLQHAFPERWGRRLAPEVPEGADGSDARAALLTLVDSLGTYDDEEAGT